MRSGSVRLQPRCSAIQWLLDEDLPTEIAYNNISADQIAEMLFDRPADEKAFEALLKAPAICGLTESLTDLSATERRTIFAGLSRARLLAGEDPHNSSPKISAFPVRRSEPQAGSGKFLKDGVISVESARLW